VLRGAYNLWLELILFKNQKTKSRDTVPLNSLIFIVLCTLAYCTVVCLKESPFCNYVHPQRLHDFLLGTVSRDFRLWTLYLWIVWYLLSFVHRHSSFRPFFSIIH
jgi:hypothetical protein